MQEPKQYDNTKAIIIYSSLSKINIYFMVIFINLT